MHRMPLHLLEPSTTWDRNLSECNLFERTLNRGNLEETHKFLDILEEESISYEAHNKELTNKLLVEVQGILKQKEHTVFHIALKILHMIVRKASADTQTLSKALKLRGDLNFEKERYHLAFNDYEMVLLSNASKCRLPSDVLCIVYARLTHCYYEMHSLKISKMYYNHYERMHATLNSEQRAIVEAIDKEMIGYKSLCLDSDHLLPVILQFVTIRIPYNGFNNCLDIKATSNACSYRNDGIYANSRIPRGSLVFVDTLTIQIFSIPRSNCEVCYRDCANNPYSCFNCRLKIYCSVQCMDSDKRHNGECLGYRHMILLILGATHIYRMCMEILNVLKADIFKRFSFHKCKTAETLSKKLYKILNSAGFTSQVYALKLIKTKPKYEDLLPKQYSTVVATAFRLTIFIEKRTDAFETLLSGVNLTDKQKLIFVGSLLMRIHAHLLLNSCDIEYSYERPYNSRYGERLRANVKPADHALAPRMANEDIWKYYNINIKEDIVHRLAHILKKTSVCVEKLPLEHQVRTCEKIQCWMTLYRDAVAQKILCPNMNSAIDWGVMSADPLHLHPKIISDKIALMTDAERLDFVAQTVRCFHHTYEKNFPDIVHKNPFLKQVAKLYCPVLRQFRHSCIPNVEVIVMENGTTIGKALRDIEENEELVVTYKANYQYHERTNRRKFLEELHVTCVCEACTMPEREEPTNIREGVFCNNENCGMWLIVPSDKQCPNCGEAYESLTLKHRTVITALIDELDTLINSDEEYPQRERDIFIIHLILYRKTQAIYGPQNEVRLNIELHYIKYLIKKNFIRRAYTLICDFKKNMLLAYPEEFVWFTFYNGLLKGIMEIMLSTMNEASIVTPFSMLLDLCNEGIKISSGQLDYLKFHERFDIDCADAMNNWAALSLFKQQLLINYVQSLKTQPVGAHWDRSIKMVFQKILSSK